MIETGHLKVISQDGLLLTSEITEPYIRFMSTIGDGEFIEQSGEHVKEGLRKIMDGEADTATISITLKLKKSGEDSQLVTVCGKTKLTTPAKEYSTATFVSKDYLPTRNRDNSTLYHSNK